MEERLNKLDNTKANLLDKFNQCGIPRLINFQNERGKSLLSDSDNKCNAELFNVDINAKNNGRDNVKKMKMSSFSIKTSDFGQVTSFNIEFEVDENKKSKVNYSISSNNNLQKEEEF